MCNFSDHLQFFIDRQYFFWPSAIFYWPSSTWSLHRAMLHIASPQQKPKRFSPRDISCFLLFNNSLCMVGPFRKVWPKHISRREIWPMEWLRQPWVGWRGAKFVEEVSIRRAGTVFCRQHFFVGRFCQQISFWQKISSADFSCKQIFCVSRFL